MSIKDDIVVVGAGPAGAMAAMLCARGGASVRLVDRSAFPRDKVCGCCVNGRALATLDQAGLMERVGSLASHRLEAVSIHTNGRSAWIGLDGGLALSRRALDMILIDAACEAGVVFEPETTARVSAGGRVELRGPSGGAEVEAGCVIVADGLGGRSLERHAGFEVHTARASRIGVGAVLSAGDAVSPGRIVMACGRYGYVGLVQLGDGRLDVAAAFCPSWVRGMGGPAQAILRTLESAGVAAPPGITTARWSGTPRLTSTRARIAATRVLVVGDSAGYVEPFTGEGIAWALAGGAAVSPLALQAAAGWDQAIAQQWSWVYRNRVRRRQWGCRVVAGVLRRPLLTAAVVGFVGLRPALASRVARSFAAGPGALIGQPQLKITG